MEKKMETSVMGYTGTNMRIRSFWHMLEKPRNGLGNGLGDAGVSLETIPGKEQKRSGSCSQKPRNGLDRPEKA